MKIKFIEVLAFGFLLLSLAAVDIDRSGDCGHSDLVDHRCHLQTDKDSVELNSSSIKIEHGGRFSLTELPIPGKDTEWEEAKILKLGDRSFLEFLIWDRPTGLTEAQSLRWVTFEIVMGRLHKIGDEIVQERSRNTESPGVQEFVSNERDDFGLTSDKNHILWRHGDKKKIIK